MIFFPPVFIFSPLDHSIISTFRDSVIGGKYGKREIKSYNVKLNYGKLGKKCRQ